MSIFGTLGLSVIILGYVVVGAVVFSTIETRHLATVTGDSDSPTVMNSNDLLATLSTEVNSYIDTLRGHTVDKLWQMTEQMNILYPVNWTHNAAQEQTLYIEKAIINKSPSLIQNNFYKANN